MKGVTKNEIFSTLIDHSYVVLFTRHKDDNGVYWVATFPDLYDGVLSDGKTLAEVRRNAADALATYLSHLQQFDSKPHQTHRTIRIGNHPATYHVEEIAPKFAVV